MRERLIMTQTTTDIKDGHYRLGEAYLKDKQYAEAITHFQKVLRLDADFIDGALLPGSCATAKPSVTIAARAARNMPRILSEDFSE